MIVSVGLFLQSGISGSASRIEYPMIAGILSEARSLRLDGDFLAAEELLNRAQRIAPRSADVYLELAHLRKDQGDYAGLRDVVDFGAEISDGPLVSVSQLQILRKNLTVLLPIDTESPFQSPPLAQIATATVSEERQREPLSSSTELKRTEQRTPQQTLEVSASSETEKSMNAPIESGPKSVAPHNAQLPAPREATIAGGQRAPAKERAPALSNAKAAEIETVASSEQNRPIIRETGSSTTSGVSTTEVKRQSSKFPAGNLMGLGILARAQSGSWISSGPIEREY